MTSSFSLSTRPWLPVRSGNGSPAPPMGLYDLFTRAHELSDIELPFPPSSAQLWRVLTLLTARITGLDSAESLNDWYRQRAQVLDQSHFSEASVGTYFSAWEHRFDLLHPERPWSQDPRLLEQCSKPSGVNKLAWGRTAGQNQVWLGGHHHDLDPVPLPPDEAAWHLLATLGYGPSGRCTARKVGERSEANSTAGPLRGTVSFHPVGRNLFESLLLNIPYPGEEDEPGDVEPAPWERDELPDPLAAPQESTGLAGTLLNQASHAVLLVPSSDGTQVVDAYVTWARRERPVPPTDPYLIHQTSKEGRRYARPADASRAIWRDLDSLLSENGQERFRPELFTYLTGRTSLPTDLRKTLRLRAFAFDQDGQTRDRQWFTASTPPVLRWLEDSTDTSEESASARDRIRLARQSAEALGRRLQHSLTDAWKESNSPTGGASRTDTGTGPWLRRGLARYWSTAEKEFWRLAMDPESRGPGVVFSQLALAAYDEVTAPYCSRPRAAKVVERHRSALFSRTEASRTIQGDNAA
ncbi:type I-E CRISPR-associated protein Cse1/CasA [Nocardiopsis listeri]|uniref:type I-E CRISPR-associated protein Cse1/CasA n=1 Tax=Nocardiopsis listeri TaxID=53440 RepID=UPI00082BDA61|nr:type I-E CRISPR-associated protein Cse1/CasA [Nocardiopsis listeri]